MMVKIGDPGMQAQEFLRSFFPLEVQLLSLLTPCGTVRLFNQVVAPGRRDDLPMFDALQARDLPDRGSITPELIGVNDLWDVIFTQQSREESFRSFGIPMPPKKNVEHETVLVYRAP